MSIEPFMIITPVIIATIIVVVIAILFDIPAAALGMAYVVGYMLIAIFLYFFYKKSKEEDVV